MGARVAQGRRARRSAQPLGSTMRIHLVAPAVLGALLVACDGGDGSFGHAITGTVLDVGGNCLVGEKHQVPCDSVASYLRDSRNHALGEEVVVIVRAGAALSPSNKLADSLKAAGFTNVTAPTV